jgi:hypothetical protein
LLQRLLDQAWREAHKVVFGDDGFGLAEQVERFLVVHTHAGAPKDFERGVMNHFALCATQQAQSW